MPYAWLYEANSVVADGNCARQLFDVRHHHVEMATAALRRPDAGNASNGRPLTERQHSRCKMPRTRSSRRPETWQNYATRPSLMPVKRLWLR